MMKSKYLFILGFLGLSLNAGPLMAESGASYTNTQAMPIGNAAGAPEPGQNPNPESPAIYPQNQDYIQTQTPSDKKGSGAGIIEVNP